MKIKRNLLFFVGKESGKIDGKLKVRIRYENEIIDFNTGYRVEHDKWIKDEQRCKRGTTHGKEKNTASDINKKIEDFATWAGDAFKFFEYKDTVPTADEFRNEFNRLAGKKIKTAPTDFFQIFDEFIRSNTDERQWTVSTIEKFTFLKKHIKDHNPEANFDYFNEAGLNKFFLHLRDVKKFRSSTTQKQISLLKWFMRWASKRGFNTNIAFVGFRPFVQKTKKQNIIFLTWDEFLKLYNFKIPKGLQPRLEKVRDVFLFMTLTALRFSDVKKLKKSDIRKDTIDVLQQKVGEMVTIDLNQYSRAILDKYKDYHFEDDLVFPMLSEQKTNDYIRELCAMAGINEPTKITYYQGTELIEKTVPKYELISTKAGRKTFISNSLNHFKIPTNIVMEWSGHSSYEAMKPYVGADGAERKKEMRKWDKTDDELLEKLKELTPEQRKKLISKL